MKNQQAKQQEALAAAAATTTEAAYQQQQDPAQASNLPEQNDQSPKIKQPEKESEVNDQISEDEDDEDDEEELYQMMVGRKVNKAGMVVHKKSGTVLGRLVEGKLKRVSGKKVGENGIITNDKGKIIGRVEPIRQESSDEEETSDDDDQSHDDDQAKENEDVDNDNESAQTEEKMKDDQALETEALATEMADEDDQDIIESNPENVDEGSKDFVEPDIAEQKDTTESVKYDEDTITTTKENIDDTAEAPKDETEKVTNAATIEDTIKDTGDEVAENDRASQEPVDSIIKDAEKEIQNLEIGDAKPDISGTSQEDEKKPFSPYDLVDENSPEVCESGKIVDMQENVIGTVNEVMAPKLAGFKVDKEGNVINHEGHIVAKAELYAPEEELFNPNPTIQKDSPEVRESGKVVDNEDNIVGAIDKQLASKLVGFKVNKDGDVINPEGHIVARAELIKVDEKDKPFNSNNSVDENSPEVKKSGKILDMDDNLVGYVDKGVASKLAGFKVDREGNIIDHEGHIVGRADMIKSEEEKEEEDKPFNPNPNIHPDSPEVRKSGKVLDMDDNIVGHVDKELAVKLAGFKVDPDGYIINDQGHTVGKAQMLERMTEEERKEQTEEEEYRKIANQMSQAIQQSLDKIKPILKEITDSIDDEESKSQKERDEQKLVDHVKPLIEQASSILQETNGAIRGLDPSGRIAKKAQGRTFERKASPEEHHLADLLAQLSGEVTTTIDKAKKKIRNMPHAKRELSPLWNILESPLLQILSGVGLLLTGVLGLVGSLLNNLGLGHIINSVLGGIGLNKILEGFGLGNALNLASSK